MVSFLSSSGQSCLTPVVDDEDKLLEIFQGSADDYQFNLENEDGTPINLTGITLMAKAILSADNPVVVFDKVLTVVNPTTGIAILNLNAADTAKAYKNMIFEIYDTTGKVYFQGLITITPSYS